ncbi:hypothetical protein L484_007603 [Morus notabilis]|uniref:Secreted protein n=1 Tax=Morus notabilis TaxID=981085 RepID=W9S8C7_9ROSA|nr:hypothetical protein L484_007603 [Morus notabilis]
MSSAALLCFFLALASAVLFVCFARDSPSGTEDYRHDLHHPLAELSCTENIVVVEDYPEPGPNPKHDPLKSPPPQMSSAAGTAIH